VAVGFWINASSLTCQVAIGAGVLCGMVLLQPAAWLAAAPADGTGAWPRGRGMQGMAPADQRFIVMMIPHHDGAIAMAELARTRARRAEIKALAQQIETSQRAENAQMRRWWQQWYGGEVPIPAGAAQGAMPGMGWMAGSRSGMASSLEELRRARDFDRAFIEQMIPHHRMGVMMASHAQWNTRHAELRALQAAMVSAQSREIRQMEQWYRQWYGASAPGTAQPLPQ
jgi:uncharacterized protein (DUF305 family)